MVIPDKSVSNLMEKLTSWEAIVISKDESEDQCHVVSFLFLPF